EALGVSAAAAQKRIARAIERLRESFQRRGVTLAADVLAAAMTNHGIEPAPAGLANSAASAALSGAVLSGNAASMGAVAAIAAVVVLLIGVIAVAIHAPNAKSSASTTSSATN